MSFTVLLIDSDPQRSQQLVEMLKDCCHVEVLHEGVAVPERIDNLQPEVILCDWAIQGHSALEICEYVEEFVARPVPLVLLLDVQEQVDSEIEIDFPADVVLQRPLQASSLIALLQTMHQVNQLQAELDQQEAECHQLRQELEDSSPIDPVTRFYRFEVFKHLIILEVRRAKRYFYPLSLILVRIDRFSEMAGWLTPAQREQLFNMVGQALTHNIRDTDIPLHFAEDKMLVVMPHTPLEGVLTAADRIRACVANVRPPPTLAQLKLSLSVAVASTQDSQNRTFGILIKEAMRGLHEASEKGGNVVMVCRSGEEPDQAGVCVPDTQLGPRTYFV